MDIEKLLEQAADCSKSAAHEGYHLATRAAYAQVAAGLAAVAHVMIEYERWQDERLEAERQRLLATRNNEPPF